MSEQNLNDMSNALEKTAYVENGKLYDNNNNLVDVANTKIISRSYVGNGTSTLSIQIPENQYFFVMLSDRYGNLGIFVTNCICVYGATRYVLAGSMNGGTGNLSFTQNMITMSNTSYLGNNVCGGDYIVVVI